jgi:hypothetical protein
MEQRIFRTFPEDPDRCQGLIKNRTEQCWNRGLALSDGTFARYCLLHGGHGSEARVVKREMQNYQLAQFKAECERLGSSPKIKSLRDEIVILRMMAEKIVNKCDSAHDLVTHCNMISDLMMKIEKVVTSCDRLELKMGELVDKPKLIEFANVVVGLIARAPEITDEQLSFISEGMMRELGAQVKETAAE